MDALITMPGCPSLAVEVDGVHHCIAYLGPNGPLNFGASNSWPDGATQLRDWTLRKMGYRVANVMFHDVSPKALKHPTDQAQQPHNSVVQTVARIVRSGMEADAQQLRHTTVAPCHTGKRRKAVQDTSAAPELPDTTSSRRSYTENDAQAASQSDRQA